MNCKKLFLKKKAGLLALTLTASMVLGACSLTGSSDSSDSTATATATSTSSSDIDTSVIDVTDMFTERDLEQTYDESEATTITLADGASEAEDSSVTIDGDTITITQEGVYVISGTLSDGQIVIDADDDAKIQLVFDGVTISNSSSACVYVINAKKVFITTTEGSENTLNVTGDYVQTDDNNVDGAIFAKSNLTLNGTGTLTINADYGHGIVCKDDLRITGGTYNITSADHGITGKDSIRIYDGIINITCVEDGLHSGNDDDDTVGYIYIAGGTLTINAGDDGIHADLEVRVDGGTIDIQSSYEGIEGAIINIVDGTINVVASDDGFNAAGGSDSTETQQDEFASEEGTSLNFYGGTTTIDAGGDGVDSNGDLLVAGGTIYVNGPTSSADGALDYNGTATITGGVVVAVGASGMAENFGDDSTQGSILVNLSSTETGEVQLLDSDGNVLVSYTPTKEYQSVVISSPDITSDGTYTLVTGDTTTEITMDGYIYGEGNGMGMGGGMGGNMGGGPGGDNSDFDGEMPDMDSENMPEMDSDSMPSGGPGNGGQAPGSSSDSSDSDSSDSNSSDSESSDSESSAL